MKKLLLNPLPILKTIDKGAQGSPQQIWSKEDRSTNWAPFITTSQYVPLSTNRYMSLIFAHIYIRNQGGETP